MARKISIQIDIYISSLFLFVVPYLPKLPRKIYKIVYISLKQEQDECVTTSDNEDKLFNMTRAWDKEKCEFPTGIEAMASQILIGRSNQLSYERLVLSWAIY